MPSTPSILVPAPLHHHCRQSESQGVLERLCDEEEETAGGGAGTGGGGTTPGLLAGNLGPMRLPVRHRRTRHVISVASRLREMSLPQGWQ